MPLRVYHLRRWLATIATLFTVVVAGMYFYARQRQHNFLKEVPGKIGYDVKQTAKGFQFSKSDGGRTLFTIEASNLKQFKLDGRAELHDVSIVLYGRDSSRFDRISGDNFTYDPKTGNVSANGEVQIDLQANPSGLTGADQAAPQQPVGSIHLKTRDLVFNRDTGNASTDSRVEFRTHQATGWAVGVRYAGRANSLTLDSQIHVLAAGASAVAIQAAHGVVTNEPTQIALDHPTLERDGQSLRADEATLVLGADNNVEHVFARGNITAEGSEEPKITSKASTLTPSAEQGAELRHSATSLPQRSLLRGRANQGELSLGKGNRLQRAILEGDVHFERAGTQPMQGYAGRVAFDFSKQDQLRSIHADEGVRLTQVAASEAPKLDGSVPQNFELTAPVVDFFVAKGHILQRAVTTGKGQITVSQGQGSSDGKTAPSQRTVVTAGKFDALFAQTPEGQDRLTTIHGAPEARIVSTGPGTPDRLSTSDMVDANFLPQGGIESITQQGHIVYTDAQTPSKKTQAWADRARYTPDDQILVLTGKPTGKPRITDGSMTTSAATIRINRASGDAQAAGDVKSTYSQLREEPQGALLASASPIHVTAESMIAHNKPAVAIYSGRARLWQDANIIEAPSIQFDRECRCVTAQGTQQQQVSTALVQSQKSQADDPARKKNGEENSIATARLSPILMAGSRLTYADADRKIRYEGGVTARGTDFTASAKTMDMYLKPRSDSAPAGMASTQAPAQLDRIVAQDDIVIQQPGRRAVGKMLVYEAASDKFTLTGGPPSIFDAERGKITGVSLTFFRADDRVLVEGAASTPVVTQTRVAR